MDTLDAPSKNWTQEADSTRVMDIPRLRLHNQGITRPRHRRPADLVAWLGAVQAQEFEAAKWALALRLPETVTAAAIQAAFDSGQILRTHVMRPTWHFVAAPDIRWMLELTAPRVHRTISHYCRRLGLDRALCTRAAAVFERALEERPLTRQELGLQLGRAGIVTQALPLAMLTMFAELEGVVCSGPRNGREPTYAQLSARAPNARRIPRDEALAELCARYFRSHGPATIRDFVWWSGLSAADARRGLEINRAKPDTAGSKTYWRLGAAARPRDIAKTVHLLPIYDEYLVSYRDREAVPHGPNVVPSRSGGAVTFRHTLVAGGQVAGTWRTARAGDRVSIEVTPLVKLTRVVREQLRPAAERYSRFLGMPVALSISS